MKKIEPNQNTDEESGGPRIGELQREIPEELFLFSNPCIIAEFNNGIIVYDCYVTDGSRLESEGIVEFTIAKQLSFINGTQPAITTNVGKAELHHTEYIALHFYMEWLINKYVKEGNSMESTRKLFKKLINKR